MSLSKKRRSRTKASLVPFPCICLSSFKKDRIQEYIIESILNSYCPSTSTSITLYWFPSITSPVPRKLICARIILLPELTYILNNLTTHFQTRPDSHTARITPYNSVIRFMHRENLMVREQEHCLGTSCKSLRQSPWPFQEQYHPKKHRYTFFWERSKRV